jgi:hypothetical protein
MCPGETHNAIGAVEELDVLGDAQELAATAPHQRSEGEDLARRQGRPLCVVVGVASPQARPPSAQTGKWSILAVPINNEVGDLLVVGLMDGKHFMKRRAHHLFLRGVGDTPERKRS